MHEALMLATAQPYPQYVGLDGKPLDGGKIYFGLADADPQSSPLTVYWDADGTQPAAQPISTLAGFAVRSGAPALVYAAGDYSLQVCDAQGQQVLYVASALTSSNSAALQAQIDGIAGDAGTSKVKSRRVTGGPLRSVEDRDADKGLCITDCPGADPTGATSSTNALQFALDHSRFVTLPDGVFRIDATVFYKSGHRIRGAGPHNRGYYSGEYTVFDSGTIILIDGAITAFSANAQNCIAPEISGLTFYVNGKSSGSSYGTAANCLAGTVAIDETGVCDGQFHDIQAFNVEHIFRSRSIDERGPQFTARNRHRNIVATDCGCIGKFDAMETDGSGAADIHFEEINGAIHLNTAFHMVDVDGWTLSHATIFQCYERQIYAERCPFVTVSGTKLFENGLGNAYFKDCDNVNFDATVARAGWYTNNGATAVFLDGVEVANIQGVIERPKGYGVYASGSQDISINCTITDPANGIGAAAAVYCSASHRISINGSIRVAPTGSYAVNATDDCTHIGGAIVSDGTTAGAAQDVHVSGETFLLGVKPAAGVEIAAGGSLEIARRRVSVPAGTKVRMTYAAWCLPTGTQLRIGGDYNSAAATGSDQADRTDTTLFDNSAGSATVYELIAYIHNPTGAPINTTAADEASVKVKAV